MTTTVKIEAHCNPDDTEVHVSVKDQHGHDIKILQDGESWEVCAWDERVISVYEMEKGVLPCHDEA